MPLDPSRPSHRLALALYWMRERKGHTLASLGEIIGRTKGAVLRWEQADTEPRLDEVGEIAEKLGHRFLLDIVPEKEAVERERIEAVVEARPAVERVSVLRGLADLAETDIDPALLARAARLLLRLPKEERAGYLRALEDRVG
jgi:transcriptional regulator with XRE-family HTH domain